MSAFDPGQVDRRFEQSLLDAARTDDAPRTAEQAWADFSRAIQLAAAHIEPASGVHSMGPSRGHWPPAGATGALGSHSGLARALLWLAAGALGGSVITATVLSLHERPAPATRVVHLPRTPTTVSAPASATVDVKVDSTRSPVSESPTGLTTSQLRGMTMEKARSARSVSPFGASRPDSEDFAEARSPASTPMPAADDLPSSLALEVIELDAIRSARRSGANAEVIRLVTRYHREFPSGVLAPDADVLALEALAAQHDYAGLAEQSAAFLRRYPRDPHAAKVRALAEWAAPAHQP